MSGVYRELSRIKNHRDFRTRKRKIDNLYAMNSDKQYQTSQSNIDEGELQDETESLEDGYEPCETKRRQTPHTSSLNLSTDKILETTRSI